MRHFLIAALNEWQRIPRSVRAKGALMVPELRSVDARYVPTLPKDALIVNSYVRILDRADGFFTHGSCKFPGGQRASHDRVWIRAEDWQALLPAEAKQRQEIAVPAKLIHRLARYHLVDNTRGEPPMWGRQDVRKAEFKLVVEEVGPSEVRLKLTGVVLLATSADAKSAKRGYDASVLGELRYDPAKKKLTRFQIVALGEHWGEGTYTGGARPGRTPLGVAFELGDPNRPADRVPPQAIREGGDYWNAER